MGDGIHGPYEQGADIRPIVAVPASGNRAVWVFVSVVIVSAGLLFYALEARRTSPSIAAIPPVSGLPLGPMIASPPDIQIPAMPQTGELPSQTRLILGSGLAPDTVTSRRPERGRPTEAMPTEKRAPAISSAFPNMPSFPAGANGGVPIVYNATPSALTANGGSPFDAKQDERVTARLFRNPSMTVPKGTIMQAVLETALDSNRGGFARALISDDVYGFDGKHVLVPRGSRLVGEYKADLGAGQNRALVQWQRLMRPDGVMIDLDSPSADPLGRAGIRGKVDGHFLERFGGAILQSTLDIGVQLATRRVARDTVVVALPGTATSTLAPSIATDRVQRTLTVHQGASVSVFVSRDLDFSTIGQ